MHYIQRFGLFGLIGWMTLALAGTAHAQDNYLFAPFNVPGVGSLGTSAFGINDRGVIVGNYGVVGGTNVHAFVFENGVFIDVDPSGSPYVDLFKINNRGVAVGNYNDPTSHAIHGFLCNPDGAFTYLPDPVSGVTDVQPWGINDAGIIVGFYTTDPHRTLSTYHGFMLSKGVYTLYDFPGSHGTLLYGINNAGQIVGSWSDAAGHDHGFVLDHGNVFPIDFPGAVSTDCLSISNNGLITGTYLMGGKFHGFVLDQGIFRKLDYPGFTEFQNLVGTYPLGINNSEVIVGTYDYYTYGFVAVPTD